MAIYPKAVVKLLSPENSTEPVIRPRKVVFHSAVSSADSLAGYFGRQDVNVESHFYVRHDGTVEQMMNTERQADAQFDANVDAVSIETEDGGHPDSTPWNPAQVAALVELTAWLCRTHGIPAVKCPTASGSGIGYHSQFEGSWSKDHRTCPGKARIPQVPGIISAVAGANARPGPGKTAVASRGSVRATLPAFPGVVKRGSRGPAVKAVQARLKARGWRVSVDSVFGPDTEAIVKAFQREKRLSSDGVVGPLTWRALWLEKVT